MQIPHSLHSFLACERQHKSPHRLGACNPSNPEMITKIVIKFAQSSKKNSCTPTLTRTEENFFDSIKKQKGWEHTMC